MILFQFGAKNTTEFFKKYKGLTVAQALKVMEVQNVWRM